MCIRDRHRDNGLARTPDDTAAYIGERHEKVERGQGLQHVTSVVDDILFLGKDPQDDRSEQIDKDGQGQGDNEGDDKTCAGGFSDPDISAGADVLPDKGCAGQAQACLLYTSPCPVFSGRERFKL